MKNLITGGAGFIGSNLAEYLIKKGDFVRCVDNFSTGRRQNIKNLINRPNFELIEGDLRSLNLCRKIVKNIDFVYHQAVIPSVTFKEGLIKTIDWFKNSFYEE